jgi:hypothetical protein
MELNPKEVGASEKSDKEINFFDVDEHGTIADLCRKE